MIGGPRRRWVCSALAAIAATATRRPVIDAVVVGAGPNGLAAAVTIAQAGHSVVVLEAAASAGGGTRTAALTLPGFLHDVCSAIHPLGVASPCFSSLPLAEHGLEWIHPEAPAAHPLPDGTAVVLDRSLEATASSLGPDAQPYRRLAGRLVEDWELLAPTLLGPLLRVPRHPFVLGRFGMGALWPATMLARGVFRTERARALFAGLAAHSMLDLGAPLTASVGLMFVGTAHTVGWPMAAGGSGRIADALVSYLRSLGGEIRTGTAIGALGEIPRCRVVLFDLTPRQILDLAGDRIPQGFRSRLERYRYGAGSFKIDYALDGPVPWAAPECAGAGSVHVGGTLAEIEWAEREVAQGRHPQRPFVLCTQPSLFDPARAPGGSHTFWAYCHVPNGSGVDMTGPIERQIERFAPGFRDRVLARHVMGPAALEAYDRNYVGGDIGGGSQGGRQLLARPVLAANPYALPLAGRTAYLCSSSTPPGAGVHGMCGWWAAQSALKHLTARRTG